MTAIIAIADEAHAEQKRRGGEDYINHVRRVATKVRKHGEIYEAVGWLHDVIEDSEFTAQSLIKRGVPGEIVELVILLTKPKSVKYESYITRVRVSKVAKAVKLADIADNLNGDPTTLQVRKYGMGLIILMSNERQH